MTLSSVPVDWAPMPNRFTLELSRVLPPAPHTSAAALLSTPTGLLGVFVHKRGWDIPGGHIEAPEDAQLALIREIREEAGVYLMASELSVVGYSRLEILADRPEDYAYPYPLTHQPIFRATLTDERCRGIRPQVPEEVLEARIIPWAEVPSVFAGKVWLPLALSVFAENLKV